MENRDPAAAGALYACPAVFLGTRNEVSLVTTDKMSRSALDPSLVWEADCSTSPANVYPLEAEAIGGCIPPDRDLSIASVRVT